MSTLGSRIRSERLARDMTQDDLAAVADCTKSAVNQWEKDATQPTLSALLALSRLFGRSVDWFLNGESQEIAYSDDERELCRAWRKMPDAEKRRTLLTVARSLSA